MAVCVHDSDSTARGNARISEFLGEETPTFLCGTRSGLPVALTREITNLAIPVGQLLPDLPATLDAFADHKMKNTSSSEVRPPAPGLREFFALPKESTVMLTPHDLAVKFSGEHLGSANNKQITVKTRAGRKKVSIEEYMKLVKSSKPDAYVAMCDSPPSGCSSNRAGKAVQRTLEWLDQCLEFKSDEAATNAPKIFAPIQGGCHLRRRLLCANEVAKRKVDGYVIDDLQSESPESRLSMIESVLTELADGKPRLASGLSDPGEILRAISLGVDVFDSTFAEVLSENGRVATFKFNVNSEEKSSSEGRTPLYFNVQDDRYILDDSPLAEGFESDTCLRHTKAYVCHLVKTEPLNALILLYSHNTYVLRQFFEEVRQSIKDDTFQQKKENFLAHYERHDDALFAKPNTQSSAAVSSSK